ncbi:SMC domain protein [Desulfitobacterium hafniense DCB-2]|nr:AAA family ATPase [Desulfitobacterium hafniense]ACL18172.1 SMC domain protein [Desulfitobacterium hafniense DCB-2]KTE93324.1 chromosome segregation protein SMC [Desulfitobacterium hafniense]CDX00142.1 SMC domain protein [Desulfitobacterium hafniense]
MKDKSNSPLIKELKLANLLSFGSETTDIQLNSLNVVVGPNGSGKSNLIDAISLLQASPSDLAVPIRKGGGIRDWLWRGMELPTASMEVITPSAPHGNKDLRYYLAFTALKQRFELIDECLETKEPYTNHSEPYFYYRYQNGNPVINNIKDQKRMLKREDIDPEQSILSQRKDPDQYPEITWLGKQFAAIRIYREWNFGRKALLRQPQGADAPNDYLAEDCSNLGLVLNKLRTNYKVKKKVLDLLSQFYEGIDDFDVIVEGGTVQLFLQEGEFMIPATRLSDGTLRFLCLLAILCNPDPPPLICIEEPELGIHSDIIPVIGQLLKDASKMTQLIVTTHSEILVDELTDMPEAVLVCEKHEGMTRFRRLEKDLLKDWLERYSLGELWRKGEIGGTRW